MINKTMAYNTPNLKEEDRMCSGIKMRPLPTPNSKEREGYGDSLKPELTDQFFQIFSHLR